MNFKKISWIINKMTDDKETNISPTLLLRPENTRGRIQMIDYCWTEDLPMTNEEFSHKLFEICFKAINKTNLKIVHNNICILPLKGHDSELGSTAFFSLDSSHTSFHLFWESRLLAIDVFGCSTDEEHFSLMNEIDDELKVLSDGKLIKAWYGSQPRFHFIS